MKLRSLPRLLQSRPLIPSLSLMTSYYVPPSSQSGAAHDESRLLLLRGGRSFFSLLRACAAEGIKHGVVTFMACVLEIAIAGFLREWESDLERPDIRFWIVYCHF